MTNDPHDELIAALHGPECLSNRPNGGKMRQPHSVSRPWEALGISRATWYRQGKPDMACNLASRYPQKSRADGLEDCSVRTIKRIDFAWRYGVPDVGYLAFQRVLPAGMLEKVAKWMLDEQRLFLDKLLELTGAGPVTDEYWNEQSEAKAYPIAIRLMCHMHGNRIYKSSEAERKVERERYRVAKLEMARAGKRAFDLTLARIGEGEVAAGVFRSKEEALEYIAKISAALEEAD